MDANEQHSKSAAWNWETLHFQFSCDDENIVQAVRRVVSYWHPPSNCISESVCRMTCTRQGSGWLFTGSQEGMAGYCADASSLTRGVEADATMAILNRPDLFTTVHGALVQKGNHAALIVGPSLSGKSTLAWAMSAAGWTLHSDDVVTLHPGEDGTWKARGVPRRVSIRQTSRPLIGDLRWRELLDSPACEQTKEGLLFHAVSVAPGAVDLSRPVRLNAIVFLNRAGSAPTHKSADLISLIHPADALLAICPYTNTARAGDMASCISRLGPFADAVPAYDLERSDLPAMVSRLENLLLEDSRAGTGK